MAHTTASILVIDDEEIIREALEALLIVEGYRVTTAATAERRASTRWPIAPFDAVLLDLMLPDKNGLEVLQDIRRLDDELPVVMITAFGTIENAVAATKQGAFYYFTKPFKNDEVLAVLAQRRRAPPARAREPRAARPAAIGHAPLRRDHRRRPEDEGRCST